MEYFSLIHVNEIESELGDASEDSFLFDLTKGLRRKFNTCEYKPRPLGVPFFYAILSLPFFFTNNYYYSIPSLCISLLLIIICILKTNWKLRRQIRKYLMNQNRTESKRNLKIHELKHMARQSISRSQSLQKTNDPNNNNNNSNDNNKANTQNYKSNDDIVINDNENNNNNNSLPTSPTDLETGNPNGSNAFNSMLTDRGDGDGIGDGSVPEMDITRVSSVSQTGEMISKAATDVSIAVNQFVSYDAFSYEDLPSKLLDFADIDKGDISQNDEGGVVPREIGWYLFCGGFYMLLIMFLTQLFLNIVHIDKKDTHWIDLCNGNDYLEEDLVEDGTCLVKHATISSLFVFFGYCIFASTFVFQVPTHDSQQLIYEVEENIKRRFQKRARHKMEAIETQCKDMTKRFVDLLPINVKWHLSGGVIFWGLVRMNMFHFEQKLKFLVICCKFIMLFACGDHSFVCHIFYIFVITQGSATPQCLVDGQWLRIVILFFERFLVVFFRYFFKYLFFRWTISAVSQL